MKILNTEEIKKANPKTIYSCGSERLSHEIRTKLNLLPIRVYQHKNGKIINEFIMCEKLSNFLKEWTNNNPKRKEGKL